MTYPPPQPHDPSWQQPTGGTEYPGLPPEPVPQYPVQPYPQQQFAPMPPQRVARRFCIWSIVSAVLSGFAILSGLAIPCIGPILLGIMGAASGHVAENQTRGNAMDGRGLAMVGIVAGWTAPFSSMVLLLIVSGSVSG